MSFISILSSSWCFKITPKKINTILKSLNSKIAAGIEKILTKRIRLASDILVEPLSIGLNNSVITYTFPNYAEISSVVPIYNKTDNKYVISYFRLLIPLDCFTKVCDSFIKNELLKSMNVYLLLNQHIKRITICNITYLVKATGTMEKT